MNKVRFVSYLWFVSAAMLVMPVQADAAVVLKKEQIVFSPEGGGNPVSIDFNGRLFTKKNGIVVDAKAKDSVAKFIHDVIETNKTADIQKIVAKWAVDERPHLTKLMSDKPSMDRNQALFANMRKSRVVGVMEYGRFLLVYVLHDLVGVGDYIKLYPITEENDRFYLTNKLNDDFFYNAVAEQIIRYQWQ